MKKEKKLRFTRETVRKLTQGELVKANGGLPPPTTTLTVTLPPTATC